MSNTFLTVSVNKKSRCSLFVHVTSHCINWG